MPVSNSHDVSQYSKGLEAVYVVSEFALFISLYLIFLIAMVLCSFVLLVELCRPLIGAFFRLTMDYFPWFIILVLVFDIFTTRTSLPTPVPDLAPTSFRLESGHKTPEDVKAEVTEKIRETQEDDRRLRSSLKLDIVLLMEHIAKTIDEYSRELDSQNQI